MHLASNIRFLHFLKFSILWTWNIHNSLIALSCRFHQAWPTFRFRKNLENQYQLRIWFRIFFYDFGQAFFIDFSISKRFEAFSRWICIRYSMWSSVPISAAECCRACLRSWSSWAASTCHSGMWMSWPTPPSEWCRSSRGMCLWLFSPESRWKTWPSIRLWRRGFVKRFTWPGFQTFRNFTSNELHLLTMINEKFLPGRYCLFKSVAPPTIFVPSVHWLVVQWSRRKPVYTYWDNQFIKDIDFQPYRCTETRWTSRTEINRWCKNFQALLYLLHLSEGNSKLSFYNVHYYFQENIRFVVEWKKLAEIRKSSRNTDDHIEVILKPKVDDGDLKIYEAFLDYYRYRESAKSLIIRIQFMRATFILRSNEIARLEAIVGIKGLLFFYNFWHRVNAMRFCVWILATFDTGTISECTSPLK